MPKVKGRTRARAGISRGAFSWCLFDWANSPFPTVVVTFVFAAYFTEGIVGDSVRGTALWGNALALSGLAIAFLGPILGAFADAHGQRKPWLLVASAITVVACGLLWTAEPQSAYVVHTLVLVVVANTAFELGMVFYNAMLPELVSRDRLGRLSGWAWGLGYAGGLVCLVVALFGLVRAEPPPFGLDPDNAEPVRAVAVLVSIWFIVFAWPLFAFVPDGKAHPFRKPLRKGWRQLRRTLGALRGHATIVRFLIARMFFIDGLNTLFAFGGIFAAGTFGMTLTEVLYFGVALNVTAGVGAFAFAWVDDWLGAKRTLIICLCGLLIAGIAALLAPTVEWFWGAGLIVGIFIGPTQSASRSLMARLTPRKQATEMFGLFALSGRVTAFAGPALVGWVTLAMDSQRWGMATIYVFFVVGLILLLPLKDEK